MGLLVSTVKNALDTCVAQEPQSACSSADQPLDTIREQWEFSLDQEGLSLFSVSRMKHPTFQPDRWKNSRDGIHVFVHQSINVQRTRGKSASELTF